MCKKVVIFDWGDTVMKDFSEFQGPMVNWPRVEVIGGIKESLSVINTHFTICIASNAGAQMQNSWVSPWNEWELEIISPIYLHQKNLDITSRT